MRDKILKLMEIHVGSFDALTDIKLDGFQDIPTEELPADLLTFREAVKKSLADKKEEFLEVVTAIYTKHLTTEDIDELVLLLDELAALRARTQKFEAKTAPIENEVLAAEAEWRKTALNEHTETFKKMLGIVEPAPIDAESTPLFEEPVDEPPTAA